MDAIETNTDLAGAYAFLGNSFLQPMTQTESVGLDPEFWKAFPDFDDADVRAALDACTNFAKSLADMNLEKAVERVSVEYTHLFIGPPKPAAAPWETLHSGHNKDITFGEPTFDMQRILREAGLQVSNENKQYADHIGLELLYLSEMCRRKAEAAIEGDAVDASADVSDDTTADADADVHAESDAHADADTDADNESAPAGEDADETSAVFVPDDEQLAAFIDAHLLNWIDSLLDDIRADRPGGYFDNLVTLAKTLIVWDKGFLANAGGN